MGIRIIPLSAQQVSAVIHEDLDGYIQKMSEVDIRARSNFITSKAPLAPPIQSRDEYRDFSAENGTRDFTPTEVGVLEKNAAEISKLLEDSPIFLPQSCMETQLLANLTVRVGCINSAYESGLPHTRMYDRFPVILIPGAVSSRILLHEMVHVIQKMLPGATNAFMTKNAWRPYFHHRELLMKHPLVRINPDTNGISYLRGEKLPIVVYTSNNPSSPSDSEGCIHLEHPFEEQAYLAERDIFDSPDA